MYTAFFALLAGLVSVVNPLGAMPVFLALTKEDTQKQRNYIALKSSGFFVLILLVAYFLGIYILNFFHITVEALRIAGGLIIFGSGRGLLKGEFAKNQSINKKVTREALTKDDISLTPLAIPMLSGPGSISYLIGVKAETSAVSDYLQMILIIICSGIITYLILRLSSRFTRFLGQSGLNSISRILGFIVMSIGIQYLIMGITAIIKQSFNV